MTLTHIDDLDAAVEAPRFWTRERLVQIAERVLGRRPFIAVSNREPYIHRLDGDEVVCVRPVSGLVTAMEPVMRACGGTWVAHGSGNADRDTVDAHDHVAVPPEAARYTLRRVWLSKADEDDYYYGFANQALWPLCHVVYQRPVFDPSDWAAYVRVNEQFAAAVLEEAGDEEAIVLIQDYHFALLPGLLRRANPRLLIAQFWHVPWPNREAFRVCPWGAEILDGLLGNDLLGFHIRYHCHNFLDTVATATESLVDMETSAVTRGGRRTLVRPFPISVDLDALTEQATSPDTAARVERWRHQLGLTGQRVILGIDRIDYTKGIPERLRALDRLLAAHPEYQEKLTFVQIGAPSRSRIPVYQSLAAEIEALVEEINWKYAAGHWMPVVFKPESQQPADVVALYRLADVCVVTALHDGMNLVAKEYVASRADGDGVLVLSRFTGSAREFEQALCVNPFAVEEVVAALHQALGMDESERRTRMAALRDIVARNNVYRWAGKMVLEMGRIAAQRTLGTA
ncbi:trehalose-6-phosphate synthase [Candidatus Binatia bacterium]|nr:trehalose-6-phosphate synthase [Candidatus Binatia bacterium]